MNQRLLASENITYCRVGAGAVVTKDVPDNTTVVGVPAKELIKSNAKAI